LKTERRIKEISERNYGHIGIQKKHNDMSKLKSHVIHKVIELKK